MIVKFSKFEVAAMKRTMRNIDPLVNKQETIKKKMQELKLEYDALEGQVQAYKQALLAVTKGTDPDVVIACNGVVEVPENPELTEDNNVEMTPSIEEN